MDGEAGQVASTSYPRRGQIYRVGLRVVSLAALMLVLPGFPIFASLTALYISQNGGGSGDGASCANARPAAWFNDTGNWGSGANQIGGGTTIHLCGTFTAPANDTTMLTVHGSGSEGSAITLLSDPNDAATFNSPAWAATGAINVNGNSYVVVDGNGNGAIQNTANGVGLAYQQKTTGIYSANGTNVEIKGWTIGEMYTRAAGSTDSHRYGDAIKVFGNSNGSVHHNTVRGTNYQAIIWGYPGGATTSSINIYNNSLTNFAIGIRVGDGNEGAMLDTALIHDNVISSTNVWDGSTMHCAPIHVFMVHAGTFTAGIQIYNNLIVGDPGGNTTAMVELEQIQSAFVYNNIVRAMNNNPATGLYYTKGIAKAAIAADQGACASAGLCRSNNTVTVTTTTPHNRRTSEWVLITGARNHGFDGAFPITVTGPTTFVYSQTGPDAHSGGGSVFDGVNNAFYNNIAICAPSQKAAFIVNSGGGHTWKNNISACQIGASLGGPDSTVAASDNNIWYGLGSNQFYYQGRFMNFGQWRGLGYDANSSTSVPQLDSNYVPRPGSPAISRGVNLTSLGIAALNRGAPQSFGVSGACGTGCATRLSSGAWDIGAYPGPR